MSDVKVIGTPLLANYFRLSKEHCPQTDEEKNFMAKVPFSLAIESLMYTMVCALPDVAYLVGVVSRFMSNLSKQYQEVVKWILRYLQGTIKKCSYFRRGKLKLQGYVDSDFWVKQIIGRALQGMCLLQILVLFVEFFNSKRLLFYQQLKCNMWL